MKHYRILMVLVVVCAAALVVAACDTGGELARNVASVGRITIRTQSDETNAALQIDNRGSGEYIRIEDSGADIGWLDATGALESDGGIAAVYGQTCSPRLVSTCNQPARATGWGTDSNNTNSQFYIGEIFVPCSMEVTGIDLMNGSAVAGNVKVGLADSTGDIVATSATTPQAGTDAYQRIPFTAVESVYGPATYYLLVFGDTTGATQKINSILFGNCATAVEVEVYATGFTDFTPPTTFTANYGRVAKLY